MTLLFGAAAFFGAALLFLVEPMLAKLVLPYFGGSPMVWNTCTLFFQTLLLAGYAYVHVSTRRLGARRQPWLHLALLVLPVIALPVALPDSPAPPQDGEPALWLLRVLVLAAGLPFALLATTGPLLQRWLSWTAHPRAADPYFLFAASNAGSVVGLLGYPFLVEPTVGLDAQARWWSVAYVGFAALVVTCGVVALRTPRATPGPQPAPAPQPTPARQPTPSLDWTPTHHSDGVSGEEASSQRVGGAPTRGLAPSWGERAVWAGLAFLPASLMLGVTTHVSTDIAAIPLFWTVPLAVYLATFVVAFNRRSRRPPRTMGLVAAALSVPVLVVAGRAWVPAVWFSVTLDLALLAAVGLAAHGRLSATRPAVEHLTGFYLVVAFGGALGGLLNGLVAPVVLDRPLEFPVVVALVPLVAVGTGVLVIRAARLVREPLVLMSLILVVGVVLVDGLSGNVLRRERTFFGSYKVTEGSERRVLIHGTTLHGWEELDGAWAGEPTSYYSRGGPIGDVMSAYRDTAVLDRVALVGLGVGTLAAYGTEGQRMDFYEIDPVVADLARSSFGYLRASRADVSVVLGDARLSLARAAGTYGLIVLDAFTSDAIPAHLLTGEAVRGYVQKLASGGLLAVHVSNRHLDLAPVLAATAQEQGLMAYQRHDGVTGEPASPSSWVVLARSEAHLERLLTRPGWQRVTAGDTRAWTDDYSSVLQVLDVG